MLYNPILKKFIDAAELGSIRKAAEKNYISSTGLQKEISNLENQLELKLFNRTYKGVELTESGKKIYDESKLIVEYCDKKLEKIKNEKRDSDKVIKIVNPFWDITTKISNIFKEKNKKVAIFPFTGRIDLLDEVLDVLIKGMDGFVFPRCGKISNLKFYSILNSEIYLAVKDNRKFDGKDTIAIEDIKKEKIAILEEGFISELDKIREDLAKNENLIFDINSSYKNGNNLVAEETSIILLDAYQSLVYDRKKIHIVGIEPIQIGIYYDPEILDLEDYFDDKKTDSFQSICLTNLDNTSQ